MILLCPSLWVDDHSNDMTGPLPDSICDIIGLRRLYLMYNQFSGRLPDCFGMLRNLEYLYVS